jgi:formylglycine-generating enzyme required for sulfatase activity
VSWNDIQTFITKLNQQNGKNYRLPREAEWEYAARSGGQNQLYSGGSDVNAVA